MPKISASSVAEHVARQEQAVFATAVAMFAERGYHAVSLGDIAAAVGLARNSLYRYFPDKAHILLRWFRQELPREAERSRELLSGDEPPRVRVRRWALHQLDYARTAEHALITEMAALIPDLDADARAELAGSHRQLQAPLDSALRDAGFRSAKDRRIVAELLGGLLLAASGYEAEHPNEHEALRRHVLRAIDALLADVSG